MIDQNAIDTIFNMYPWATEETAVRLAELSRSSNIKSSALAVAIAQTTNSTDVKAIERLVNDAAKEVKETTNDILKTHKAVKSNLKSARSSLESTDGLQAIADLTYAGSQALHRVGQGVAGMTGAAAPVLTRVAGLTTSTAVATAAVGTVFASLMTEQEKSVRAMLDFGMLVSDDALYTDLRSRVSQFAMGVTDYLTIIENTREMMTGVTGDAYQGQAAMAEFLASAVDDETLSRFGMSPSEYATQLANEAALLYRINEVQNLGIADQRRIIDSFNTVNRMGIFMANSIGLQRSQALELRQQARENADFQLAMLQNAEYITETFGENASQNITEANDFIYMLMSPILGEEMASTTQQAFANTLRDIQFDTSAVNNIPTDMLQTLQRISPEAAAAYISIIEDGVQGRLDAEETFMRVQNLARIIRNSPARFSADDIGRDATAIKAQIATVPQEFFEITSDSLEEGLAIVEEASDIAGLSVDTLGDIAVTYRQVQNAITPGYETMADLFGIIVDSATTFGEVWARLFGLENFQTPQQRNDYREMAAAMRRSGSTGADTGAAVRRVQEAQQGVNDAEMVLENLESRYAEAQEAGDIASMRELSEQISTARERLVEANISLQDARAAPATIASQNYLDQQIGALSARYESAGDYSIIGDNPGDPGGISYGKWQIATRTGTMATYMSWLEDNYPQVAARLNNAGGIQAAVRGDPRFREAWRIVMSEEEGQNSQRDFIGASHYDPAVRDIRQELGIDVSSRSRTLQDVIWSTSVGHGAGGAVTVLRNALDRLGPNPTDEELIRAIYQERAAENGMRYYPSASPSIRSAVVRRYGDEGRDALEMLAYEMEQAASAVTSEDQAELRSDQARLESEIAEIQREISLEGSDMSIAELTRQRMQIRELEEEMAAITDQLNSLLASDNTAEATP